MSKAVFIQNPDSKYNDQPGRWYHFPRQYIRTVTDAIGDWVVFYEGRRGRFGYTSVQKVVQVRPDNQMPDHFYADLDLGTLWQFERTVPRADLAGRAFEAPLRGPDGRPMSGGANVSAVRRLGEEDFRAIVAYGLEPAAGPNALPRSDVEDGVHQPGMSDSQLAFDHAPLFHGRTEILSSRKARDASFARLVKRAYDGRCAFSGLSLRNGGGRAEVQAAHIRPVKHDGPDETRNGIALSGTLHWMFDRGLLTIADDNRTILVAENKVSKDTVDRLIVPDRQMIIPKDPRDRPHPAYLRFHREEIYGNSAAI